eukprot:XP_001690764.1 predicted protein [Chlamydomonas reinhardtii]
MLAVSKGPRPAGALLPKTAGPSSSVPRPSQRAGSAVAVLGGGSELFLVPVASRQLLRSGDGGAATAARIRSGIIAGLAAGYLRLVPRIRKAIECRIPLWAMAKAGISGKGKEAELTAALLQRLVTDSRLLGAATPMDLCLVLYALGKLREDWQHTGEGWQPCVRLLAEAMKGRLAAAVGHGFNAQDVSNALWACAKLGYADADLLQRLAEAGAAVAKTMIPQDLSNILWALKALGCTGPAYQPAVGALCEEALRRLRTPKEAEAFRPQHLSNILLALEGLQLGGKQAELLAAVATEDLRRGFSGYNDQDLTNSAWALAKMEFGVGPEAPEEQRKWISAAVDAAKRRGRDGVMAGATPQAWSNLLYALALVRHQPPPALLDAGAAAAILKSGNGQDCASVLYALAVLRLRHGELEAAVCGRLGALLKRDKQAVNHQCIATSLWGIAVPGGPLSAGMQQLAVEVARDAAGRWEEFTATEDLAQMWQAQQELGGEVAAALGSNGKLQAAMDAVVAARRDNSKPLPDDHKQLLAALRRLEQHGGGATAGGLALESVQTGVVMSGVLAPLDAVVRLSDGRQVALELVGAVRFLSNRRRDPAAVNGSTAMRHRHVRREYGEGGVLMVPYWEWESLTSPEEQEAYLLRRLQALLLATAQRAVGTPTRTTAGDAASPTSKSSSCGSPQLLARPPRRVP